MLIETVAGAVIVYVRVASSDCPSPFGLIASGCALTSVSASTAAAPPGPSVPRAGRRPGPASICQRYGPTGTAAESQVQSTVVPKPSPAATSAPAELVTPTCHASALDSRARKRIGVPTVPVTFGSYSFGRPTFCAAVAIEASRP